MFGRILSYALVISIALMCESALPIEPNQAIRIQSLFKTSQTWKGDPIIYPSGKPEITAQMVEIVPGGETGWHSHPVASMGYLLEGELTVYFRNGETRHLRAGEAAVESINTAHNGINSGNIPSKLVVFYVGELGGHLVEKSP